MQLADGVRFGPYETLSVLGAGGMGEVYRARDVKLRRDVAIKVLPAAFARDPERVARFRREAQVLATLNHPHIAAIYGVEAANELEAIVLELVEGPTLADRIARGPVPLDEVLTIATQIAEALDAAHEKGIVHRDLKPANIKITPDDQVKVLDFGLAKALAEETHTDNSMSPTMTAMASRLGVIVGTAAYMSPEQAKGKPVDKRADIWAFGCVLYEILTGKRAFAGDDVTDFIVSVMTKEPNWTALPAATPLRVVELLKRCLKKDPRERLRDIGDARSHLEEAAPATAKSTRRNIGAWLAFSVVGVAIGAAVTIAMDSTRRAPEPARSLIRFEVPAGQLPTGTGQPLIAVSPNGRYLAYVAPREGVTGEPVLWIRAFEAEDARPIEKTSNATFPFWSPDSHTVGFLAPPGSQTLSTVNVPVGDETPPIRVVLNWTAGLK
jgi:serine/threonine protein kinase